MYRNLPIDKSVTIPAGQSQSGVLDKEGFKLIGLIVPAGWTAADITFLGGLDPNGAFSPLYKDDGTEVTITVSAGRAVSIDVAGLSLAPWRYLKLRSGSAAAPVNQAADRLLQVTLYE